MEPFRSLFWPGAARRHTGSQPAGKLARLLAAAALTLGAAGLAPTAMAANPDKISFTLEGCRNTGDVLFEALGPFVCELPDTGGSYTTGNLGKGWAELDLVPHRVTAGAGNAAPANQTYTIAVVVDTEEEGTPGYDFLSAPVLNEALSDAGCNAPVVGPESIATPGLGGISKSLYRLVTITQAENTECVYDFYARLALGSNAFSGASLHANLALQDDPITTSGIGAKEVSIPDIEAAQTLAKTMEATQDSSVRWGISKSADPGSLDFGDVCRSDAPEELGVDITVEWTKVAVDPTQINVATRISANNPASRPLNIAVTDVIYNGTTELDSDDLGEVPLGAKSTLALVGEHEVSFDPDDLTLTLELNDIATATYIDPVPGHPPIEGTTTATANATVQQGDVTNADVAISDSENITGDGLSYSADGFSGAAGAFQGGYVAGTETNGTVDWLSVLQGDSGSVTFTKTVYLDEPRITSGVLSDQAKVNVGDTVLASTNVLEVPISSSATVALTLIKTIPDILDTGESLEVSFEITRSDDATFKLEKTLTFEAGETTQEIVIDGLVPDDYVVKETGVVFFADALDPGVAVTGLVPEAGDTVNVDLDLPTCSDTARFDNVLREDVMVQVQKITEPTLETTDPDFVWEFRLTGSGGVDEIVEADANGDPVLFDAVLGEGSYTVTETLKSPAWDLVAVNGDAEQTTCDFTVDLPEDEGQTKSCIFKNVKRGLVEVLKTLSGGELAGTDASFTFQLREGASATETGTVLEEEVANALNNGSIEFDELLIPGDHYQLCEIVLAGWQSSLDGFVPAFSPPDSTVDNSIICVDFTVEPGETKVFEVDNTPPPGGHALTIGYWKNHASCMLSNGKQDPVLDQTLYLEGSIQIGLLTLSAGGNPDEATDCTKARALLDKRDVVSGKKRASEPLFNLAAQLVAVKLNLIAGAGFCPALTTAVSQADTLLINKSFTGTGAKANLNPTQAALANQLAQTLDSYNNNTLCP